MRKNFPGPAAALVCFGFVATVAHAQSWSTVFTPPPTSLSDCMLLTNGSVMCQGVSYSDWYKLTSDFNGNHQFGTWSTLASLLDAFASRSM
jgi:hypothetical protein